MKEYNVVMTLKIKSEDMVNVIVNANELMKDYSYTINQNQLFINEDTGSPCFHYSTKTNLGIVHLWISVYEDYSIYCEITTDDDAEYALMLYNRLKGV